MVALEHVNLRHEGIKSESLVFGTFMGAEDWVDKRRDVLHLNYHEEYDWEHHKWGVDPVYFLLAEAAARARDFSVTADLLHSPLLRPKYLDTFRNKSFLVCLRVVCIHAPLQPALESGLFGLLGDARVVLVDADDRKLKERFQSFWEQHGAQQDTDPHTASFFDKWCQEDVWVSDEVKELKTDWMLRQWLETKDRITDADAVWTRQATGEEGQPRELWKLWVPNREHWWAKETLKATPNFRPTVMFRLCTQGCSEHFKEAQLARIEQERAAQELEKKLLARRNELARQGE
jgi:hypothetical protein